MISMKGADRRRNVSFARRRRQPPSEAWGVGKVPSHGFDANHATRRLTLLPQGAQGSTSTMTSLTFDELFKTGTSVKRMVRPCSCTASAKSAQPVAGRASTPVKV